MKTSQEYTNFCKQLNKIFDPYPVQRDLIMEFTMKQKNERIKARLELCTSADLELSQLDEQDLTTQQLILLRNLKEQLKELKLLLLEQMI